MTSKPRGRPRQFDEAAVLDDAIALFSRQGYSATSLDDLAEATGLTRPSLYNAFGDKEAIYRRSLDRFVGHLKEEVGRRVIDEPDLRKALLGLYRGALDLYFASRPSLGCFMFCTAPVEAVVHDRIRDDMKATITSLDRILEEKFQAARDDGRFPEDADPRAAAKIAQGVLHSIAIRARAGEPRASLERIAGATVDMLCPA